MIGFQVLCGLSTMVLRRGVEDPSETCLPEAESLDTWVIPRRRLRLPLQSVAWISLWYGTDVPRDFWEEQVCSMRTGVSGQMGDSRPESPPHPKFTTHACSLVWDGTCPEIWGGTFVLAKLAEIPVLSRAESPAQPNPTLPSKSQHVMQCL